MLSIPAVIFVLGLGAWLGLPTVLHPIERLVAAFGADLNDVPGYVDAKHALKGLKTDDWIALDEGSWFYMPSLYPRGKFFAGPWEVLQTQDTLIKAIPEVANVLGKIGACGVGVGSGPGRHD